MIRRATDDYGETIEQAHRNQMIDTRESEVDLENGETDKIIANQIAANLYSQLDDEGHEILQLKGIIDHNKDRSTLKRRKALLY